MSTWIGWLLPWSELAPLFAAVLLLAKATLLLAVAWCLQVLLRTANPRWRVLLWRSTSLGMLVLIALTACPPFLSWSVLPPAPLPSETLPSLDSQPAAASAGQTASNVAQAGTRAPSLVDNPRPTDQTPREDRVAVRQSRSSATTGVVHVPTSAPTWHTAILCAVGVLWLAGLMGKAVWTLSGLRRLRAIVRRSPPVADWVAEQAERVKETLGYPGSFVLRTTTEVATPCLVGIWRPAILLPEQQADVAHGEELPGILMHEMAHLKAGDLPWNGILQALSMLFWFHPLVWRMRLAHADACDAVADSIAANHMGDVSGYTRMLARMAVQMHRLDLGSALAMARPSSVRRRIEGLQRRLFLARLPRGRMILVLALGVVTVGLLGGVALTRAESDRPSVASSEAPPKPEAEPPMPKVNRLAIHATAKETGKPLEGVTVEFEGQFRGAHFKQEVQTDPEGIASVEWNAEVKDGRLFAACSKSGFIPIHCLWGEGQGDVTIPKDVHLEFQPGRLIGGIVQDPEGRPIQEATVKLSKIVDLPMPGYYWFTIAELTTDAEGRWQWRGVPSDLNNFRIDLEHPDYVGGSNTLLAGTDIVYVMRRGGNLTGRVLTADGTPIERASVVLGYHHNWAGTPKATTDSEGRFVFENCKPGESLVTIEADGFSPERREVVVGKQDDLGEFRLSEGHTLRVRIINGLGEPIKGAIFEVESWQGHETLSYSASSDESGRVVWPSAPADTVLCQIRAAGYLDVTKHPLEASDEERVVLLSPKLTISGSVTDATTGRPIPSFVICQGYDLRSPATSGWFPTAVARYKDGTYQYTIDQPIDGTHRLRVEAPGYYTKTSRPFRPNEGSVTFDFALEPGKNLVGTVLTAGGEPVTGARVGMAKADHQAWFNNGQFLESQNQAELVTTDESGRFTFPPEREPFLLIVTHDSGFATITPEQFQKSSEIRLKPWGRIQGRVLLGDKPDAGREISFSLKLADDQRAFFNQCNYQTRTDADGRFVLDRVLPGHGTVARVITTAFPGGVAVLSCGWQQPIDVKSGETAAVTIGGTGRTVVGRIELDPKPDNPIDWTTSSPVEIQRPEDADRGKFSAEAFKCYGKFDATGRFEIPDVPPGRYRLTYPPLRVGPGKYEFTVPPLADAQSHEPLDLGTIQGKANTGPNG